MFLTGTVMAFSEVQGEGGQGGLLRAAAVAAKEHRRAPAKPRAAHLASWAAVMVQERFLFDSQTRTKFSETTMTNCHAIGSLLFTGSKEHHWWQYRHCMIRIRRPSDLFVLTTEQTWRCCRQIKGMKGVGLDHEFLPMSRCFLRLDRQTASCHHWFLDQQLHYWCICGVDFHLIRKVIEKAKSKAFNFVPTCRICC